MRGRAAFEQAVAEYALHDLAPPDEALAVASASLERTGVFLLGELHGIAQTPSAILGLVSRLGVRELAFEWAYDELDQVVQPLLTGRHLDLDALWALPPTAEVFSGDGRFTAGHVALLEHLREELDHVVLLDRVGSAGQERGRAMMQRLLAARRRGSRLLAVLGAAHVVRMRLDDVDPVGLLLERELPGVGNAVLAPSGGHLWFHGVASVPSDVPPADVVIPIGPASLAVVPAR